MALTNPRVLAVCAALAVPLAARNSAHAETCSYEPRDAATFGLPTELVGPTVSIAHCTADDGVAFDRMHASLRLGPAPAVAVWGPYLEDGACLTTPSHVEVWTGFAFDLSVSLCHAADGSWTPRVSGRLPIAGTMLPLADAAVEYITDRRGPVRLRLPRLPLGVFALEGATITMAMEEGVLVPQWIEGALRWNHDAGGTVLRVAGYVGADVVELGVGFTAPPPDFPFPGVTLPPLTARLRLDRHEWRLFIGAHGPAQLGPLGTVSLDGSELEVRFRDGQWAMAGCLQSTMPAVDLGVVRFDQLSVRACGLREGVDVHLGGQLSLPALGITGAAVDGTMHWDAGAWTADLAVASRIALGPFGALGLTGTLAVRGTPGAVDVDGCLRGDGALSSLAGLPADLHVSLGRCADGATAPTLDIDGRVTLPGGRTATVAGELALGAGGDWSLGADLTGVVLGPFALERATLAVDPSTGAALAGDLRVGPFDLHVAGAVAAAGPFALDVSLRAPAQLGGGVTVTDAAASRLEWTGSAWRLALAVGVEVDAGPFGIIGARGQLAASWNQATATFDVVGCLGASLAGLPLDSVAAEVCFTGEAIDVRVSGQLGGTDVRGTLVVGGAAGPAFELAVAGASDLELAPGVILEDARLTIVPGASSVEVHGRLCVGALCLEISGVWNPRGRSSLTATLAAGTPWQPLASLPGLSFSGGISGTLVVEGDAVTLDVRADSASSFALVPGLTLDHVFAHGHLATGSAPAAWSVALGGTTTIGFGAESVAVTVEGRLDSTGRWTLTGTSPSRFDPLSALIGAGRFVVASPSFTIDVPAGGPPAITLAGTLELCLVGSCAPGRALTAFLRGGVVGGTPGVWFAATVPGLALPGFGSLDATVAATTIRLPAFDLAGTPGDASDDVAVEPGVTVSAMIDLPVRLGPRPSRARLTAHVQDLMTMSLHAGLDLHLPLVSPQHKLPGISEVSLESIALVGSIDAGVPSFGVEAQASFRPSNQVNSLLGTAALSMSATGDLGVDLSLLGRWYEPFGLPKIAIQNPAFALSINVSSSLPLPSRLGWNGDFFWLKSGSWPTVSTWPLPSYGEPAAVPSNLMQLGGTFYFDAIPSPSGLCVGVCVPLPALIVRFELHHLGVADLVRIAGDVKTGVKNVVLGITPVEHRAAIAGLLPDGAFTLPVPSPLDLTVNELSLYLSTHNLTQWGMPFAAGFRAVADVTAGGRNAALRGVLDDQGLLLEGRLAPITVLGQQLTGDPTRRVAQLGALGTLTVADDARLTSAQGTVEAHLVAPAAGGTVAAKLSGLRGWRVRVRPAVPVCAADGTACRSLAPVEVILANGTRSVTTTSAPAVPPGEWHHVAATWGPAGVRILVDGATIATAATPLVTPVTAATPMTLGAGLTSLDDVRVWNVARPAAEVARDAGTLPPTSYADTRLVARYSFDFDRTASPAHNQRLLPASTPALHGSYAGGATAVADAREQDLYARLRLALPGAGASGFALQVGASLAIPALGGARQLAASVAVGDGQARGQFLMPEANLMTLPGFGTLVVGGRGPNLVAGDFDDGAFGAFDLADQSLLASAGLYFKPAAAARQTLLDGSLSWTCRTTPCTAQSAHRLLVDGALSWTTTLPGGAPMKLAGQGRFDSDSGALSVNGSLAVFGQTLISGAIKVTPSQIALRSTLDLSAVASVPLGSPTMDLSLAYAPARLCGNSTSSITLPGTATRISGQLGVCLGASPSLTFSGSLPSLTAGGITMTGVSVTYDAAGLRVAGNVGLPGVFTGRVSGSWTSPTQFQLDASASLSFAGFGMPNAALRLSPSGFRATGTLGLGLWTGTATIAVTASGSFTFSQSADAAIAGFALDNASFTLSNTGLQVSGAVTFLGNRVTIGGAYHSDGAYRWSTTATVNLAGFSLGATTVTLARYTTAHPRSLTSWPTSGLHVDGSLAMLGGSLAVDARIDPATGFSVSASPSLDVLGFALSSTSVTLSSASGLSVRGNVKVGSSYLAVSGTVTSLTSFELCSASNTSANAASGLPDLRGRFCLERSGAAATLSGTGKAIYWGNEFSTTFRISASGGIDDLLVDVAVARFEVLGLSASGRMKLEVENNDLVYVRWYGSLDVPNPIPGFAPLLDFDGHINLSGFRLCPSQFGIDPTAVGLPSGCVALTF